MNNCPKCGAVFVPEYQLRTVKDYIFECGTSATCPSLKRGSVCYEKELCQLREENAFLKRWREVVLGRSEWLLRGVMCYLRCERDGLPGVAFNAAVRKEMGK